MHSESRNGTKPRVLAVHTTEGIMRALDLRNWKSWAGSSHASADETGALLTPADGFVPYELAAWTLRSGNYWSENIELCGWARWTRAEWLSRPKLLDACARWLADRSKARGIPLVKLTPQQYRAGRSGVIGHVDHTVGYSDGTHTDPGPNFPWDVVLAQANAYRNGTQEDDLMSALDEPITKPDGKTTTLRQVLAWSDANIDETRRIVREEIATRVLETPVPNEWRRGHGESYENPDPEATTTLGAQIAWMDAQTVQTLNRIAEVNEKVDALAATLKAIAAKLSTS